MCIRESGVCEGGCFDELKVETNQSISDIFELIKEELSKEDMSYWILKNNIF